MPPICLHLGIAEEAITKLNHPVLDGNRGSYYLGSTAPDIRFFINAGREETHFLSLDCEGGMSGVQPMFEAHPELLGNANLNEATRAFVAGYLSHLVTDEAWIYRIYRPYFGRPSLLGGEPMANLLDRLLQFELDRRERLDSESMSAIRKDLASAASEIAVGFMDDVVLNRWSEFVFTATTRKSHWENFRYFAEKYLIWMQQITAEEKETFFANFDASLEQVLQMVPEEQLQAFREQSVNDSIRVAKEYLG